MRLSLISPIGTFPQNTKEMAAETVRLITWQDSIQRYQTICQLLFSRINVMSPIDETDNNSPRIDSVIKNCLRKNPLSSAVDSTGKKGTCIDSLRKPNKGHSLSVVDSTD